MIGALIILAAILVVGIILRLTHRDDPQSQPETTPAQEECCGLHEVCEKFPPADPKASLYYDDEELDRFIGRDENSYSPDEEEAFREVMLSLRPEEVYPWSQALISRGISLPLPLRDELLILLSTP